MPNDLVVYEVDIRTNPSYEYAGDGRIGERGLFANVADAHRYIVDTVRNDILVLHAMSELTDFYFVRYTSERGLDVTITSRKVR